MKNFDAVDSVDAIDSVERDGGMGTGEFTLPHCAPFHVPSHHGGAGHKGKRQLQRQPQTDGTFTP